MEQPKTHYKLLQNPDYIGAYMLMDGSEKSKEIIVTIDKVVKQVVKGPDGKSDECSVAYLKGQKPFILNSTNQKTMTKLFGTPYIEDWIGKSMTLYVARIKAFGDTVDCLRVRPTPPVITLPELTPQHPKWADAQKALTAKNTTMDAIKKNYIISPENEKLLATV